MQTFREIMLLVNGEATLVVYYQLAVISSN